MFFHIKNAVQGELLDTTAEPPSSTVDEVSRKQATDDMKEADRERGLRERLDLISSVAEASEALSDGDIKCGDTGPGLCLPATPPNLQTECDPNCSDSDSTVFRPDDPWYTHGIYVLCKNSKPLEYFNYKCLALRRMRDEARSTCLLDVNYNYRVVHCSDTQIQVVRTHKWFVVAYDEVVSEWSIYRIYKNNNR